MSSDVYVSVGIATEISELDCTTENSGEYRFASIRANNATKRTKEASKSPRGEMLRGANLASRRPSSVHTLEASWSDPATPYCVFAGIINAPTVISAGNCPQGAGLNAYTFSPINRSTAAR